MKFRKLLLSIVAVVTLSLLTACSTDSADNGMHKKTTFLGIYTSEPEAYTVVSPVSSHKRSSGCVSGTELPSGNKITWFWGLFTYTDY